MPFWALALLGFGVLLAGWLGGVGGRSWRDRARYAEIEDRFEAVERRLSKREGQAGQQRKQQAPKEDLAELASLARLLPGAGSPGRDGPHAVLDPAEMDARASRHFEEKDRKNRDAG